MASHDSTPPSILAAPSRTETPVSEQKGLSRAERRHGMRAPQYRSPEDANVLTASAFLIAGRQVNTPHLRHTPRSDGSLTGLISLPPRRRRRRS